MIGFRNVSKRFPGVVALDGVSFDVRAASCHALVGENGAGKSTLGKLLAGLYRPNDGHIEIGGKAMQFAHPRQALEAGIGIVHQELLFCPNLTVAENLCLATLPRNGPLLDRRAMRLRAAEALARVGAHCNVDEMVGNLSTGQEQLVQIASVLASDAKLIVMDEPTSSLSEPDARSLHRLIGDLRAGGTTVVYVSHRMEEIFRTCDWITVLRDGRHIATMPARETNEAELVRLMIGRPMASYFSTHATKPAGRTLLRVEKLSSPRKFSNVSLEIAAGEVVGIAGLVGSGRSELVQAIFGLDPTSTGSASVDGRKLKLSSPRQAMDAGIGLVPEDRKRQGLILDMACGANITLTILDRLNDRGLIRKRMERRVISDFFEKLRIRAADPGVAAAGLSGGNQQKLVLAKWLARSCRALILDEPTRGVDVGAKAEIHRLISELADAGCAILMISSELPEVLNLSSRVLVMRSGQIAGELSREQASQEKIMHLMAGTGDTVERERDETLMTSLTGGVSA